MPPRKAPNSDESSPARNLRKVRQGVVVSNKMDKSILVRVERTFRHPLYKKVVRRSKKFMAHDQENTGQVGDLVRIMECRPLSRHKRWRLVEVLSKAEG
ncbi:MAG: 30S ribosomal protein S17 [SAR324 cluster bacterium]|nr:30S ribosomal protein S17 [SAR324 cluster bacterium]